MYKIQTLSKVSMVCSMEFGTEWPSNSRARADNNFDLRDKSFP